MYVTSSMHSKFDRNIVVKLFYSVLYVIELCQTIQRFFSLIRQQVKKISKETMILCITKTNPLDVE